MIDISDGLVLDLWRICKESNVGAILEEEKIPVGKNATLEDALYGGEDYALLFTLPKEKIKLLREVEEKASKKLFVIGEIVGTEGITLIKNSHEVKLKVQGFDHFAK